MKSLKQLTLWLILMFVPLASQAQLPQELNGQQVPSLAPMLEKVRPAVVNVLASGKTGNPKEALLDPQDAKEGEQGPKPKTKPFESIGSGVIVDANNGYILTNSHLIHQATSITVTLHDGRHFKAKLIGSDPASDIAVLQINPVKLTALPLGDSNDLRVGDFVVAIGNPYGLNETVTSGIVSALERSDLGIEGYEDFIQTDASINPGNSGGALVNLNGELVGINTAILAPNGGNIGIGFAIPTNMAKSLMDQLVQYGKLGRGIVGVMIQSLSPELANALDVPGATGAVVTNVSPMSPADKAGIKSGDIIQQINNKTITKAGQVRNTIGLMRAGTEVQLKILRHGKSLFVKLKSADPENYKQQLNAKHPFLNGVVMKSFDADIPGFGRVQGVQAVHITENSPAWQAGLRPGDVIMAANQKNVANLDDLEHRAMVKNSTLLLNIFRGTGTMFVIVQK